MKSVQMRSFFWSVFSRIRSEYGNLLCRSTYSVRMWENTDQKKLHIWTLFTQWEALFHSILTFYIYIKLSAKEEDVGKKGRITAITKLKFFMDKKSLLDLTFTSL